jgi:hypothetical protein
MTRASTSWLLGIVLLALLSPAVALACKPAPQKSWTKQGANGRFTLALKVEKEGRPALVTLRKGRSGKVLWKQKVPYFYEGQALISASGHHVAVVETSGSVVIHGKDGKVVGTWAVMNHLTKAEQEQITQSSCGPMVVGDSSFKGEVLTLQVALEGVNRPTEKQPRGASFRVDPQTRRLLRESSRDEKSAAELLQKWKSNPQEPERGQLLAALLELSKVTQQPGALTALRAFWGQLILGKDTPGGERALAVAGLGYIGTDKELLNLLKLPDAELAAPLLEALLPRLPREAEAYALQLLEKRHPSEELRKRAAILLLDSPDKGAMRGYGLALLDPSGEVRMAALAQRATKPPTAVAFEQTLPLCEDPILKVRQAAVETLLGMTLTSDGSERRSITDALRRADTRGGLKPFPEGQVILGGLADLEGKRARALELYRRAVEELAELEEKRTKSSDELRIEALLQLALEAKKLGQKDEVSRRGHDVLAERQATSISICAPAPNRYALGEGSKACAKPRPASEVARQLLGR